MLFNNWNPRSGTICGNAFNEERIQGHFADFAEEVGVEDVEGN